MLYCISSVLASSSQLSLAIPLWVGAMNTSKIRGNALYPHVRGLAVETGAWLWLRAKEMQRSTPSYTGLVDFCAYFIPYVLLFIQNYTAVYWKRLTTHRKSKTGVVRYMYNLNLIYVLWNITHCVTVCTL